jgi:hypothetical protein
MWSVSNLVDHSVHQVRLEMLVCDEPSRTATEHEEGWGEMGCRLRFAENRRFEAARMC